MATPNTPGVQTITAITGSETVIVDAGGSVLAQMSTSLLATLGSGWSYAVNATAGSTTLLAGNFGTSGLNDIALGLTGAAGGSANGQLPLASAVIALFVSPVVGASYIVRILNIGNSGTWTITGNTGWTISGTATIATGTWREFIVTIATATTLTIQNIGGGSIL